MSPTGCFRVACLGAVLLALAGVFLSPATADQGDDSDVDLTLSDGGKDFTNSIGMKLVRIKAGSFQMGAPKDEPLSSTIEMPRHEVQITKEFYCGAYEVTQKQYGTGTGTNPSRFSKNGQGKDAIKGMDTSDFPVEQVSYAAAVDFTKKLNARAAEKRFRVSY